jgi:hypothetical protein
MVRDVSTLLGVVRGWRHLSGRRAHEFDQRRVGRKPIAKARTDGIELDPGEGGQVGRGLVDFEVQVAMKVDLPIAKPFERLESGNGRRRDGGRGRRRACG